MLLVKQIQSNFKIQFTATVGKTDLLVGHVQLFEIAHLMHFALALEYIYKNCSLKMCILILPSSQMTDN